MSFLKKKGFAVCAAIGAAASVVLTALLLLPVGAAVNGGLLGEELGGPAAWICAAVSVLAPTAVIVRARGRQALATGGAIALAYVLLAAVCCALGGSRSAFGMWIVYLGLSVAAGGLIGALTSVRQKSHRKRRRR